MGVYKKGHWLKYRAETRHDHEHKGDFVFGYDGT